MPNEQAASIMLITIGGRTSMHGYARPSSESFECSKCKKKHYFVQVTPLTFDRAVSLSWDVNKNRTRW